jgi:hypothetical protein
MGTGCIQRFRPPNHQHIGINRRRNGLVTHRWRHWGESTHNFKDSWRLRAWVGECGSVERVRSPASCRLMGGTPDTAVPVTQNSEIPATMPDRMQAQAVTASIIQFVWGRHGVHTQSI